MHRSDKAILDAFQSFLSFREGRAVQQPEAMHALIVIAFEHPDHPLLRGFELPGFVARGRTG
jgi:hypothetical protein